MNHTNENIAQKESLLKGLELSGREEKLYTHETVLNVMEEYKNQSIPSPSRGFTEEEMKDCAINFFSHWFHMPGSNTMEGFKDWFPTYIASLPQTSKVEGEEWVSVAKILTWVATVFDISDGDYYWKGDADGDQPLNGKEVFEISMLPEYQEIISQIK